jgi:RNA polymerase sigma-70 factor (ECF subfamily)
VRHLLKVMGPRSGFFAEVDEMTLARARAGDTAAMETLYRIFETPVYTLARRITGSNDEAGEILQETFLEVIRSLRRLRSDSAAGAWVRRIAMSKTLMRLRATSGRRRRELRESDDPSGSGIAIEDRDQPPHRPEDRIDLERALSELPATSRAVVWLHDVEGLTHAEIGELMGRSTSFSKSQLARAHSKLRDRLGRMGSQSPASRSSHTGGEAGAGHKERSGEASGCRRALGAR